MAGDKTPPEAVAVVGVSCRLPGAPDPATLWGNLLGAVDSVGRPSTERRTAPVPVGEGIPEDGGFLDDVSSFDAGFFGIPAREAAAMDPQQWLALELAWEAFEDAGSATGDLRARRVGVFIGAASDDYAMVRARDADTELSHHAITGLQRGVIANRVSHHLGVRGPSMVVDTGQSSSLTAVHLACLGLLAGECDVAVVGGVSLAFSPHSQVAAARLGVLSPTARCRVLDRGADGFVRGEGGACVVLKPLAAARADGDHVYCVVETSAVNHDGAGEEMAAPDRGAQAELIGEALRNSGSGVDGVQYVELHGTGTPAGDATEAQALGDVFSGREEPVAVGSVKTNIGHLEAAAGIAGLLKVVLAIHHRRLPPSLHFAAEPATIAVGTLGLRVTTESAPWPRPVERLVAGVSSFGMGGANCHVVLAENPDTDPPAAGADPGPLPYVLSARTPTALAARASALRDHLSGRPDLRGLDVAYTLATGRTVHECRAVVLARHRSELVARLDEVGDGEVTGPAVPEPFGPEVATFLEGGDVDWRAAFDGLGARRVPLPTYPFERARLLSTPTAGRAEAALPATPRAYAPALTLDDVLGAAAEVRGESGVLDHVPFKEQGFDSMAGLELRDLLEERSGRRLPASLLYDHPTPAAVAVALGGGPGRAVTPTSSVGDGESRDAGHGNAGNGDAGVSDPVAIVGMGCRYPGGVENPDDLWRIVAEAVDVITDPPEDRGWHRLDTAALRPGGFLTGIDLFDAEFFGISPREAAAMDPQQRIFLETVWEALESAGIVPGALHGSRTGVFAGATGQDYGARLHEPASDADGFLLTGGTPSVLSGRIAYVLGLGGPAITVDTACSSSLTAVHLACRSLLSGETDLAVAGGVAVMPWPGMFTEFARQGGLSEDGRCRAFGAEASGTGWAEGSGAVVLERLSVARRNGHRVHAVIRGTAVNSDGASNGLTAPNGTAQRDVINAALAAAALNPRDVDVVEAHGTGTTLGDPIEANALLAVHGAERDAQRPLLLGSLKSNIGHTQAAAGVAGLIKMVMAMRYGSVPPTLYADPPTPHVDWSPGTVSLVRNRMPWPETTCRRAGVSSFGISGTNAHVVVEQAEEDPSCGHAEHHPLGDDAQVMLAVSARTEQALRAQALRLREFLTASGHEDTDIAHSLLTTRTRFAHRAAVVGRGRGELTRGLTAVAEGREASGVVRGRATDGHRPVFVFGGQGAQWAGMGVALLDAEPVFAAAVERCERALAPHVAWSLTAVLRGTEGEPGLDRVDVVQPALFAVMVSLAELWRSRGVEPAAVIGHSQGELAAACVAGALSLEDAARVVALRSRALTALSGRGAMASIALPVRDLHARLDETGDDLAVAAENGPTAVTVTGEPDAVDALVRRCTEAGERAKRIAVDYASHSRQVTELREQLLRELSGIEPHGAEIPMMSTVHADWIAGGDLDADYWYRNLRERVRFDEAVGVLLATGHRTFVEMSPHPVVSAGIAERADEAAETLTLLDTLARDDGGPDRFLRSLAAADAHGLRVDVGIRGRTVPLPSYAFQRTSHWLAAPAGSGDLGPAGLDTARHPLLGAHVDPAEHGGALFTGSLSPTTTTWLSDHVVLGTPVVPGTVLLDLMLWAARRFGCTEITELLLENPVVLSSGDPIRVQVTVTEPGVRGWRSVSLYTRADAVTGWRRNATAEARPGVRGRPDSVETEPPAGSEIVLSGHYDRLRGMGLDYGRAFRGLRGAWTDDDGAIWLDVALPSGDSEGFTVHPALLDAVLHGVWLVPGHDEGCRLPFAWAGVRHWSDGGTALRARLSSVDDDGVALEVWDADGAPVMTVDRLQLRPVAEDLIGGVGGLFAVRWEAPRETATEAAGSGTEVVVLDDALPGVPPEIAVLPCRPGTDPETAAARVLRVLRTCLGDGRYERTRLVVATVGGDGEGTDAGHGAVWGLVRSAQAENPGRLILLDTDTLDEARIAELAVRGEPQVRDRNGPITVPLVRRLPATPAPAAGMRPGGTALVTGGTGELGALVAQRLVTAHGVRNVVLLSRRGPEAPGADAVIAELTGRGARACAVACDVTDRRALQEVLATIPASEPLTAVVHAAGVLDDGLTATMDDESLTMVMRPKASAAVLLDELTSGIGTVRAFVLFSSVAGLVGTAGQANYAAANGVLDAVARRRRAHGLPATSIAWGLWSRRSGMTAELDDTAVRRLAAAGIEELDTETGLRMFDAAVESDEPYVVAARLRPSRTGPLRGLAADPPRSRADEPGGPLEIADLAALPVPARRARLVEVVREHTAAALGHTTAEVIDGELSFRDLGCDSLIGVDLRNRLARITGLRLPATVIFSHPTPVELAERLLTELGPAGADDPGDDTGGETEGGRRRTAVPADDRADEEADPVLFADADVTELFAVIDADLDEDVEAGAAGGRGPDGR